MKSIIWTTGLLVCTLGVWLAPITQGQTTVDRKAAKAITSLEGKDSYAEYCASCHGSNGKGTDALKATIPDLTTMAARNRGNFDSIAITRIVTGVDKTASAHRSDEMPIWGPVFSCIQSDQACAIRVHNLVDYLKTIQQR